MPESTCLHIQDRESGPIRVVDIPWISVRIGRAAYCEVRLTEDDLADEACRLYRRGRSWHLVPVAAKARSWSTAGPWPPRAPLPFDVPFRVGRYCLTLRHDRAAEPDWEMYARARCRLSALVRAQLVNTSSRGGARRAMETIVESHRRRSPPRSSRAAARVRRLEAARSRGADPPRRERERPLGSTLASGRSRDQGSRTTFEGRSRTQAARLHRRGSTRCRSKKRRVPCAEPGVVPHAQPPSRGRYQHPRSPRSNRAGPSPEPYRPDAHPRLKPSWQERARFDTPPRPATAPAHNADPVDEPGDSTPQIACGSLDESGRTGCRPCRLCSRPRPMSSALRREVAISLIELTPNVFAESLDAAIAAHEIAARGQPALFEEP